MTAPPLIEPPLTGTAAIRPVRVPYRREVLANGMQVILHEDHTVPQVAVHLLVAAGAAVDPVGRAGLAHLVEHLRFEGSAHAPGNAYDELLAQVGGSSGAWTEPDEAAFSCVVPAGALALALFLESDRLGWLAPTAASLANQRAVVANERAESARTFAELELLDGLLWPAGHPYAHVVIGRPADLAAVTLADVTSFLAAHYRPDTMSLAIVGDVDPDAAMGQVRAWFADVPRADVRPDGSPGAAAGPAAAGTPPVSPATTTAWAPADVDRPRLHLAWNTVALDGVDRPALDLVAALVEDALAAEADVAVRAWSGSRGGTFTIAADAPRSPRALLRRIDRVLEALTTEGPADGDLTRVRARLRAADLHAVETFAGRAEVLDLCLARTGEPDCLGSDEAARAALTTMDIQAVVRRWLPMARRTILVVMPASRGRALLPHAVRVDLG